jgi:hypothetical protein
VNEQAPNGLETAAIANESDRKDSPQQSKQSGPSPDPNRGDRPQGRGKRGGASRRSLYSFPDGLEHCFCRNATRVPPASFPVAGREGVATPAMVELARTDQVILLCDLLHEGPHLWPDGELFVAEGRSGTDQ